MTLTPWQPRCLSGAMAKHFKPHTQSFSATRAMPCKTCRACFLHTPKPACFLTMYWGSCAFKTKPPIGSKLNGALSNSNCNYKAVNGAVCTIACLVAPRKLFSTTAICPFDRLIGMISNG